MVQTAMTAHPKVDPRTGELLMFGYNFIPPYLTYHQINAAGELVRSEDITLPRGVMMHDFAITEGHALFMDLPVVFDIQAAIQGIFPFKWSDD